MPGTWRLTTTAVLAAGAAIGAALAAAGPAQAAGGPAQMAGATITIAASSKIAPVTGDVMVAYRDGADASGKIHGTITGAAAADVAVLYAQEFPYKTAPAAVGSVTLKAATATYSFTVTPTLATRYAVRLFGTGMAGAPIATSPVQNLYVVTTESATAAKPCGRPVCHETVDIYTILPASAFSTEAGKHVYPYFGLNLGSTGTPPPPKWVYLNAGSAKVSKARRISASEYENTLTLTFTIGTDGYRYLWDTCVRDTVANNGLGLPGYHDCGVSRVPGTVVYLG